MYKKENTAAFAKHSLLRLSAAALSVSALISCALAAPATVTAEDGLRLRSDASTSSQVLSTLDSGMQVEVLEALDGWYRIEANEKTGYVSSQYLSVTGTVSASSLNVRSAPSTSGAKIATLSSGAQVTLLESLDGWFRIEIDGQTGYVSSQYISLDAVETPPAVQPPADEPAPPAEPPVAPPVEEVTRTIGTVSASSLNVRSGPASSYTKLGALASGAQVEILGTENDWHRIEFKGKTGYISSQYVTLSQVSSQVPPTTDTPANPPADTPSDPPAPAEPVFGVVSASSLNVRSGPGTSYGKVKALSSGTKVEILEKLNGWYRIDGGYVSSSYVLIQTASMSDLQSEIVAYARSFLGCDYVYGGNGPTAFDCSGLMKYIYNHFGYSINRTATQQLKNGVTVSKENLQPGDLVFFNSEGTGVNRATHVGIYIGNGQFLHASNKKVGVIITNLSDPYRVRTYTTARRII